MSELDSGVKKVLLTDRNSQNNKGYNPNFITDGDVEKSSREIYFRWLSRLVILCAIVSLGFFLSSSLVIFRLAPEIIVQPLLIISQDNSDNMVRYEPITKNMQSLKKFTELYIRQYIIMRNSVVNDEQEMQTRWGPGGIIHYLSTPSVYNDFVGANAKKVEKMFDANFSREVRIDSINKVSENSPAWTVEFTVYSLSNKSVDNSGALTLKTMRMKASITPKFIPERVAIFPRLINPLGFTVMKYNQDLIRE